MNGQEKASKRDWSKVKRASTRQVNIRLNEDEAALLDDITERAGVSVAGYVKAATFNRPIPRSSYRPNVNAVALRQLLGQMGKLGSNANQIARAINAGTLTDYQAAKASLDAIHMQLAFMREQLLEALQGDA